MANTEDKFDVRVETGAEPSDAWMDEELPIPAQAPVVHPAPVPEPTPVTETAAVEAPVADDSWMDEELPTDDAWMDEVLVRKDETGERVSPRYAPWREGYPEVDRDTLNRFHDLEASIAEAEALIKGGGSSQDVSKLRKLKAGGGWVWDHSGGPVLGALGDLFGRAWVFPTSAAVDSMLTVLQDKYEMPVEDLVAAAFSNDGKWSRDAFVQYLGSMVQEMEPQELTMLFYDLASAGYGSAAREIFSGVDKPIEAVLNIPDWFIPGDAYDPSNLIDGPRGTKMGYAELFEKWGVPYGYSLSDLDAPGVLSAHPMFTETGQISPEQQADLYASLGPIGGGAAGAILNAATFKRHGLLDPGLRGTTALVAEIATDPTTYLSLGASSGARIVTRFGEGFLTRAGLRELGSRVGRLAQFDGPMMRLNGGMWELNRTSLLDTLRGNSEFLSYAEKVLVEDGVLREGQRMSREMLELFVGGGVGSTNPLAKYPIPMDLFPDLSLDLRRLTRREAETSMMDDLTTGGQRNKPEYWVKSGANFKLPGLDPMTLDPLGSFSWTATQAAAVMNWAGDSRMLGPLFESVRSVANGLARGFRTRSRDPLFQEMFGLAVQDNAYRKSQIMRELREHPGVQSLTRPNGLDRATLNKAYDAFNRYGGNLEDLATSQSRDAMLWRTLSPEEQDGIAFLWERRFDIHGDMLLANGRHEFLSFSGRNATERNERLGRLTPAGFDDYDQPIALSREDHLLYRTLNWENGLPYFFSNTDAEVTKALRNLQEYAGKKLANGTVVPEHVGRLVDWLPSRDGELFIPDYEVAQEILRWNAELERAGLGERLRLAGHDVREVVLEANIRDLDDMTLGQLETSVGRQWQQPTYSRKAASRQYIKNPQREAQVNSELDHFLQRPIRDADGRVVRTMDMAGLDVPATKTVSYAELGPENLHRFVESYQGAERSHVIRDIVMRASNEDDAVLAVMELARYNEFPTMHRASDVGKGYERRVLGDGSVVYLPESIARDFDQMPAVLRKAPETNWFLKTYDRVTSAFKYMVTIPFGGFHTRNMASNMMFHYLEHGVNFHRTYPTALDVIGNSSRGTVFRTATGESYTLGEINDFLSRHGIIMDSGEQARKMTESTVSRTASLAGPGLGSRAASAAGNAAAIAAFPVFGTLPPAVSRRLAGNLEQFEKVSFFLNSLRKGESLDTALTTTNRFLVDYDNLSKTERAVGKRIVPFFTWQRHAIPTVTAQLWEQPGRLSAFDKLSRTRVAEQEELPTWEINPGTRVRLSRDGNRLEFLDGIETPLAVFEFWDELLRPENAGIIGLFSTIFEGTSPFIKETLFTGLVESTDESGEFVRTRRRRNGATFNAAAVALGELAGPEARKHFERYFGMTEEYDRNHRIHWTMDDTGFVGFLDAVLIGRVLSNGDRIISDIQSSNAGGLDRLTLTEFYLQALERATSPENLTGLRTSTTTIGPYSEAQYGQLLEYKRRLEEIQLRLGGRRTYNILRRNPGVPPEENPQP